MRNGLELRSVAAGFAASLLVIGGSVCLAAYSNKLALEISGPILVVVSVALFTSIIWGWPIRTLRSQGAEVEPPGHKVAWTAPVDYQVTALRQALAKLKQAGTTTFGLYELDVMFYKLPRRGTDPVYEPFRGINCDAGLARLVELGELNVISDGVRWEIPE
jgi:hypothetical protein